MGPVLAAFTRSIRQGARALTLRGKGLIAVGVGLAVGAAMSGQQDLLRIAILLIVLPIITLIWVIRRRFRLGCERVVTPSRLGVGDEAEVVTTLTNLGSGNTGGLLIEDYLPVELGRPAHRVLKSLPPTAAGSFNYPLHATQRGQWFIGPLAVTAVDPFGLVRVERAFKSQHKVTVVPEIIDLGPGSLQAEHLGHGEGSTAVLAARGSDDVVPREYRVGDDLRRVHWRASARTGALMVRREEQPWTRHATVVVDLCANAHAGLGRWSSFETAMTLCASIGIALLRRGFDVQLSSSSGDALLTGLNGVDGEARLLDALALLEPTPTSTLATGPLHADLLINIATARPGTDQLLQQQAPRGRGDLGLVFVLDTAAWGDSGALSARDVTIAAQHGGWQAAVIPARERAAELLPQLWTQLLGGGIAANPNATHSQAGSR